MATMDPREYLDRQYSEFFEGGNAPVRPKPMRKVVSVIDDVFGSVFTTEAPKKEEDPQ